MRPRFLFLAGLGWMLPGLAFAQLFQPTITITPTVGAGQKTVLSLQNCEDLDAVKSFYSVTIDFSPSIPPAGSTFIVQLGTNCDGDDGCVTLEEGDISGVGPTQLTIDFSMQTVVEAAGVEECEGIDRKLELFVLVEDSQGIRLGSAETPDTEKIFVDTQRPLPPLNITASGGENVVHVKWNTNPDNAKGEQILGAQEAGFIVLCRLAANTEDPFVECTPQVIGFTTTVDEIDGAALENDVEIELTVITVDPAGNESEFDPAQTVIAAPQDVLDFGENYDGVETGGCGVGAPSSGAPLLPFLFFVVSALLFCSRRSE